MTAYYVQPEPSAAGGETYWLEGYAVGDAKFAAAQSDGTSTTLAAPTRVQLTGMLSEGDVTSLFGGNRVVAAGVSQSPASATLAGFARVRPTGMRVDATSITLIASTRVKPSRAVSDGVSNVKIASAVTYNSNGVLSSAASEVDAGSTVVHESSILSEAAVTSLAGSLRVRDGIGIRSDATGTFLVPEITRIVNVAYLSEAQSTVLSSLSEKWIEQAEDTDIWTSLTTFTEPYVEDGYWVVGYEALESYDEAWTMLSEPQSTWTTQSPLT